jgi:hypothetical protein
VQNCTTPNLRRLQAEAYKAVVYDEADWRLPAEQRALFQSSPRPVELSQSNCNESAYSVVMYGMPQIICSNDFWKECTNEEAREWVEENAEFVRIDDPTWLEDGHAGEAHATDNG